MDEDKVKRFITELENNRKNHKEWAKYGPSHYSEYNMGYAEALFHVIERIKTYFLSNNKK